MDAQDAEFTAKLLSIFKIEAKEHLEAISKGLLSLENNPEDSNNPRIVEIVFREAHSLKGAARAVNIESIQTICQELENVLAAWKKEFTPPTPKLFNVLYRVVDSLQGEIEGTSQSEKFLSELVNELKSAQDGGDVGEITTTVTIRDLEPSSPIIIEKEKSEVVKSVTPIMASQEPPPISSNDTKNSDNTIRISIQKLDELFRRIEELLTVKLNSQQRNIDLQHLQEIFFELKKQNKNEAQNEIFKSLTDKINKLVKKSSQEEHFVSSMVDTLLEATKHARMQPFSTMLESFPRMVRDLSHALGKDVRLEYVNCDIEVDRRILEELKDPLIHLIRNSIDHGIETREEREKKGKPPVGTLVITLSKVGGNVVEILVSDDGKGIDVEKIRDIAVKQGVVSAQEAAKLKEKELTNLIFRSGISTSPIITDLSGRGLGVGIVQEKVEKLGGSVTVETNPGVGTTFRLVLPLTLATFRGIHITVSDQEYIIPISNVIKVQRLERKMIKIIEGRLSIMWREKYLPFAFLDEVLKLPQQTKDSDLIPTLIMKAGDTIAAIGVDSITTESEVFAKNLGSHLKRVKNIAAATVLEGGKVIPILDSYDIVKNSLSASQPKVVAGVEKNERQNKKILVVEDSVTTRVLLKNILEARGYSVNVAVDGQEGFSQLQGIDNFDLILSDVEMPRMTGFQLLERVRTLDKFKELPFILCTTRGSKEDLMHGIELGANAYIDKSNFTQSSLIDIIEKLI